MLADCNERVGRSVVFWQTVTKGLEGRGYVERIKA